MIIALCAGPVKAETLTVPATSRGWWHSLFGHNSTNDNYILGRLSTLEESIFRDFFVFDFSSLPEEKVIEGATLQLTRGDVGSDTGNETIGFFDVTTDIAALTTTGPANNVIFNDLGSGINYGTFDLNAGGSFYDLLSFDLNDAAVSNINLTRNGWALGGSHLTLQNDLQNHFFGSTGTNVSPGTISQMTLDLRAPTFEEVVEHRVATNILTETTGQVMTADFIPNYNYNLQDAANLGGYDHFNWLQLITRDDFIESCSQPYTSLCLDLTNDKGQLPQVAYEDAPPGGYYYQTSPAGIFPARDSLPWYLDEVFGNPIIDDFTTVDTLSYRDMPNNPLGYVIDFQTILAGVYANGTGDILDGIEGTVFNWRLTGTGDFVRRDNDLGSLFNGTIEFLGFEDWDDFPTERIGLIRSLGVGLYSERASRVVPEPASVLLFIIGMLGTFIAKKSYFHEQILARQH